MQLGEMDCPRRTCTAARTARGLRPRLLPVLRSQRAAKFSTIDTEYGLANGAYRPAEDDTYYWRLTQILFPFYNMIPTGELGQGVRIGIYVPTDDNNHLHWEIRCPGP
jgi:hypothetical protein